MAKVREYMANGVSVMKDAKDLVPGKSVSILIHGVPLEMPTPLVEVPLFLDKTAPSNEVVS